MIKQHKQLGIKAHACHTKHSGAETELLSSRPALATERHCVSTTQRSGWVCSVGKYTGQQAWCTVFHPCDNRVRTSYCKLTSNLHKYTTLTHIHTTRLRYKMNIPGFPSFCQDQIVTSHLTSPDKSLAFHTLRFAVKASLVTEAAIILRFFSKQRNSPPNMSIF